MGRAPRGSANMTWRRGGGEGGGRACHSQVVAGQDDYVLNHAVLDVGQQPGVLAHGVGGALRNNTMERMGAVDVVGVWACS